MDAPVPRQARPTTPADLHRLAARAQARGVRLTQERPGVWFCSSASGGDPHYTTGLSCDCRGFMEHQRCSHYALLLDHLGWLPDVEEPAPVSTMVETPTLPCPNCSGGGVLVYRSFEERCPVCQGSGEAPATIIGTHIDLPALVAAAA
jgi:hypothetical protein